ncbi:hypothetical protein I3F58_03050 [Streptomyces sp. MUM 203J]|uniref:hypothetical protein n=1 Tax=Streptomyces sp. MUM 203J TaxID=2791990 RepID=UPI001F045365|nr:hypothetical protein [Streptomyces sp. MUM 203J]MCH0538553.1 hypothetical protein [Streptomyces sp. MUM 203J]
MRTKRASRTLSVVSAAAIGLGVALTASPAAHAATTCDSRYKGTVESAAVKATVWFTKCSDGRKKAWGTVWDKKADSRSAYAIFDTRGYGVVSIRNSKGSGTSMSYSTALPSQTSKVTVTVKACSTWGCGDSASKTFYF